jgi:hypothetical protein
MKILGDFFDRRRTRRIFQNYLSPALIKQLEKSTREGGFTPKPPEQRHFQFVVVNLEDKNIEQLPACSEKVVDTLLRHEAVVFNISASLVLGCFGVIFFSPDSAERRLAVVADLIKQNGAGIRVAHGECNGFVGHLGSAKRLSFEAMIPNFSEILKKLLDAQFGAASEVSELTQNGSN